MEVAEATVQSEVVITATANCGSNQMTRPSHPRRRGNPPIWNVVAKLGLVQQEVTMTKTSDHGIMRVRGEDQPADKERAQLAQKIELGHTPPEIKEEANDRD